VGLITKTLRLTIIATPARLIRRAHQHRLRLPTDWPCAQAIHQARATFARVVPT
jgi:hypothetical protein